MPESSLDSLLIRVYRESRYRVFSNPPAELEIDRPSPQLAALHEQAGVHASAFVTACNPHSEPLGEAENRARQQALASELRALGFAFLPGCGEHPGNDWPREPSFLVLGIERERACALATRHEQNALVCSGPDAVPRLLLLR